jgi:hypothetical protein
VEGPHDIGLDEIARAGDGTVHMGFRREVHHVGDDMVLHHCERGRFVAEVHPLKHIPGIGIRTGQVLQMPRVGEAVQIHDLVHTGLPQHEVDEV